MQLTAFYDILDAELDKIIKEEAAFFEENKYGDNQQKPYALLIWFLRFYGQNKAFHDDITDGNDDRSCDVVLERVQPNGETIFYIIQSKWNNKRKIEQEASKDEIIKALGDFTTILEGKLGKLNPKLQPKVEALQTHLKRNGKVEFLFLSLASYQGAAKEQIEAFEKIQKTAKFKIIDINYLRSGFIDRYYKNINPASPLESFANPEREKITLNFERNQQYVKIDKPHTAYVFVIGPKLIHTWYSRYGLNLFHKNVRNPLLASAFNHAIKNTAEKEPESFWYYNNGITAITKQVPEIGRQAEEIEISGLQIINGAQTVHSIYQAYEEADAFSRDIMNNKIFVTLRLIESGSEDFDRKITRYTNSQNPVEDSDFWANDPVQIRLQEESYKYNIWYRIRRGEFRTEKEWSETIHQIDRYYAGFAFESLKGEDKVWILRNKYAVYAYIAFELKELQWVIDCMDYKERTGRSLEFISQKEQVDGLYEKIFNEKTTYRDLLFANLVMNAALVESQLTVEEQALGTYPMLPLIAALMDRFSKIKYGDKASLDTLKTNLFSKDKEGKAREACVILFKAMIIVGHVISKMQENVNINEETLYLILMDRYKNNDLNKIIEKQEFTMEILDGITISEKASQVIDEVLNMLYPDTSSNAKA